MSYRLNQNCIHFLSTACEYLGGKLAHILGLDAAKYQYAVDEFNRDEKVLQIFCLIIA